MAWEDAFAISISDAEAERMFKTRQSAQCIYEHVRSPGPEDQGCLAVRAFNRLRKAFLERGVARGEVTPDTKLTGLLPDDRRRDVLNSICERAGLLPLRRLPFGLQLTFGRVRDVLADSIVARHQTLRLPGHSWSLVQVREVVRLVMYSQLALRGFSDDAEFISDLKID